MFEGREGKEMGCEVGWVVGELRGRVAREAAWELTRAFVYLGLIRFAAF